MDNEGLLELLQEVGGFEVIRHGVIKPRYDLVNGFLPWLLRVFSSLDSLEKLPKSLFNDEPEVLRNLGLSKISHGSQGGDRL